MIFQRISNDILFVIVTYKEKYYECNSYTSLKNSFLHSSIKDIQLNVYVGDNTDVKDWNCSDYLEEEELIKICYKQYDNPGLSYVYNKAAAYAKTNNFSWIVLLDQDTLLPLDFYKNYLDSIKNNTDITLKVPIIKIDNNRILSPAKYKFYRSYLYKNINAGIMNMRDNSFINTGMLINTDFFLKVGGYNECIKLDFTDHDFVHKCKQYIRQFEVINVELKQDFSSVTNTKKQAIKRYLLYLRDLKEFKINKENGFLLFINSDLLRLIKLTIQYKTIDFIKLRFKK
ncbi:glycosyltransferase [Chryseobacterium sp. TY4]